MNCDKARERMVDSWAGRPKDGEFRQHIDECSACREEFANMSRTWEGMSKWPDEEPGPGVRARFYQMLEAYEEGRREREAPKHLGWRSWLRQPAFQIGFSVAMLALGIFAGTAWHGSAGRGSNEEVAALKSEVQNMRQLVALSLLQQQSASERLRGVNYSYRVEPSDMEVLSALLRTVKNDPNVNVRLSAVDALRQFGDSPVARRGIAQALGRQESALVEVALLDVVRDLRDKDALPEVRALADKPGVDPAVRERAKLIAGQLGR